MSVLSLQQIGFSYGSTPVLRDVSYDFEKGKMYCIVGRSGAGKTTLLSILSGLAVPDSGRILYEGKDIRKLDKYKYRSKYIGVVFQSFNLITKFTAAENVILSMEIAGVKPKNKRVRYQYGKTRQWKKAIVTVAPGEEIEIFSNAAE